MLQAAIGIVQSASDSGCAGVDKGVQEIFQHVAGAKFNIVVQKQQEVSSRLKASLII